MTDLNNLAERLEPLKMHLISQHEDKDTDSLLMRYCELLQYTEDLEVRLKVTQDTMLHTAQVDTAVVVKLEKQRIKLSSALYFYHKAEQGNPKVLSQDGGRVATETLKEVFGQQFAGEFL